MVVADITVWLCSSFVPALQLIMWPAPPHGRNHLRAFPHVKVLYKVPVIILLAMFTRYVDLLEIKSTLSTICEKCFLTLAYINAFIETRKGLWIL